MKGRMIIVCAALVALLGGGEAGFADNRALGADTLRVMFWNLENFFDYRNGGASDSDAEFSSYGDRHWSKRKFRTKCQAIAKSLLWTASHKGALPDIIGVAEVENAFVLKRLLQTTALRKLDYKLVHFESPDPRGIDVALLYRASRLKLQEAKPCHLFLPDSSIMPTRDILLAEFDRITVLVNHHPSKYGGLSVSESKRTTAVRQLRHLADSLLREGRHRIVAMGDFNDTPANPLYKSLEPALFNLADSLHRQGKGTIKFEGKWELIDLFFVSEALLPAAMEILYIPFLQTRDGTYSGTKPLRTFSGPRYLGGVSDHCPVWLEIGAE